MKMLFKIVCVVMVATVCLSATAQDIHFSQFYGMPILRNPALTGLFPEDIRGTMAYRSQWTSINAPYRTMAAGVEFNVPVPQNVDRWLTESIGLQVTHDVAGDSKMSKTQVMPVLNFHMPFNKETNSILSVGFMGGLVLHSFKRSDLVFDDQFVNGQVIGSSNQKFDYTGRTYFNGGIGAVYNYGGYEQGDIRYYAGMSVVNLTPDKSVKYFLDSLDMSRNIKFGFNAGGTVPTGDDTRLNFYVDYFRQSGNNLLQMGAFVAYDFPQVELGLAGGVIYRWADAIVPVVNLEYKNLLIGLSYDANANNRLVIAGQVKNVFELLLSYKGFLNILDNNTPCPKVQLW
jgi:type IX secretion system PorP/SprF family membrane protein